MFPIHTPSMATLVHCPIVPRRKVYESTITYPRACSPSATPRIQEGYPDVFKINWTDGFKLNVENGKTYMLRIINAALNDDLFFKISGHKFTVVEVDAVYTKPFKTGTLLITPGQTTNVLLTADQSVGRYLFSVSPFMDARLPCTMLTLSLPQQH